ncbi:WhiB family transcriptional regulator [Streptomyces canus]|uniref:WhiB family transcriptional regulator n=1 Tax=Streptomyces canus TaxID=58343 RepID=UPI0036926A40
MRARISHTPPVTLPRPPHWGDDAACQKSPNPDLWFAEGDDEEAVADRQEAKQVCGRCPSRSLCLHAALERGETTGVWGGLDHEERAQLTLLPSAREPAPTEESADGPRESAKTA